MTPIEVKKDDVFTMEGKYRRRTLWQWLMGKPRELQQYKIIDGER